MSDFKPDIKNEDIKAKNKSIFLVFSIFLVNQMFIYQLRGRNNSS